MDRAIQATERLVRRVETEFGLLNAAEISERHGIPATDVLDGHRDGTVLAIKRRDSPAFPGFQFRADGTPRPIVRALRTLAATHHWSESDLFLWLVTNSGYLGGERPVDVMMIGTDAAEGRLLSAAEMEMTLEW